MKKLILSLIIATIGSAHPTTARAITPEKRLKFSLSQLQETYAKSQSLEADIIQEVYQASLGRTKTSQGNIRLTKPNKMRWETYKPEENVTVSDGSKLWYYNPKANAGKGQAVAHSAREITSQPLYRILSGSAKLDKEFKIEKLEHVKGIAKGLERYIVVLKPLKPMGDLEKAQLTIDSKYLISELLLENSSGNRTKISLQNQALGTKFPSTLFNFTPPPGTEILKGN